MASFEKMIELIQHGTAAQVRELLESQTGWWKWPIKNPVLDLLLAVQSNPKLKEPAEKLQAMLDHGLEVEFSLANRLTIDSGRRRQMLSGLGNPQTAKNRLGRTLLGRVSVLQNEQMAAVLLASGASALKKTNDRHDRSPVEIALSTRQYGLALRMLKTLPHGPSPAASWLAWAPRVLRAVHETGQKALLRHAIERAPDVADKDGREAILGLGSDETSTCDKALTLWCELDGALWEKLHDKKGSEHFQNFKSSWWPVALRRAVEAGPSDALFRAAIEHAKGSDWLAQPIDTARIFLCEPTTPTEFKQGPLLPTWEHRVIPLPALQALLHGETSSAFARRASLGHIRNTLKTVRILRQEGAFYWNGANTPASMPTEAMLANWQRQAMLPRAAWWARHPEFLQPHPSTGQTPLHTAPNTQHASLWISAGVDPKALDHKGNQAACLLLAQSCIPANAKPNDNNISTGRAWAGWIIDGWASGDLPSDGQALGGPMAAWAAGRNTTFKSYRAKHIQSPPGSLHIACLGLAHGAFETLLSEQHALTALDGQQLTPMAYLAWRASSSGLDGNDDRAIKVMTKRVKAVKGHLNFVAGQRTEPWQMMFMHRFARIDANRSDPGGIFTRLHEEKCDTPEQWQVGDTNLFIQAAAQADGSPDENLMRVLPQGVLDDMLLALLNPARSSEAYACGIDPMRTLVDNLLRRGANPAGHDMEGHRLIDVWSAVLAREMDEDGRPEPFFSARSDLLAIIAQQKLDLDTPVPRVARAHGRF